MIIYDKESKKILKNVTLFLTPDEANELGYSATDLSEHPEKQHHHVPDADFKNDITICVYTRENMDSFDEESKSLIQNNG